MHSISSAPPLTLSMFNSPEDVQPKHWQVEGLAALALSAPHEAQATKRGALWSPAQYLDGRAREKRNVYQVSLLCLDVDEVETEPVDVESLAVLLEHVDGLELERWVHSTYSHAPLEGRCKVRIVCSLSRPVLASEWPAFFAQATREICPVVDPSTSDASRMFYGPTHPPGVDPETLIHDYQPGRPIDVDAMLARATAAPSRPDKSRAVDTAPAPGAPIEVTDRMREASTKRLESLARRIRTFPQGSGIYAVIRDAAFEIGGRVGAGALSLETAKSELNAAHKHRNPNPDRVREKTALVDKCLAEGASRPWCPSGWFGTTDAELSAELVENHGAHIRYVESWAKWIGWDGTSWNADAAEMALLKATESLIGAMQSEAEYASEGREKALKAAIRGLSTASGYRNMLYMARMRAAVRIKHEALDADPWALATPKGVIDLRTGHTHDHDPARLTMRCTDVHPDPSMPATNWRKFLGQLTKGDAEVEAFLQRAIGYSLTGHVEPHALFLMHGGGGNGKGAFVRALKEALGTYAISAAPHLLLQKTSDKHETSVADLHRRRFATISEVEEGKGWDEVELKALVDSDDIRARRMREDAWEFTPTHHFWVSGNYTPSVRGVDNGVWRRLFLIPCASDHVGEENLLLQAQLAAEAPAILAWAIEGCLEWQRRARRLDPPEVMQRAKDAYRYDADTVRQFVDERCELAADAEIPAAQIFQAFVSWSAQLGHAMPTSHFLGRRLARFATAKRNAAGARAWAGIRMKGSAPINASTKAN